MNYLDQLQWRYATKQFDATAKIPANLWDSIEDSLVLTPSSFGLQPWRFFVITDPQIKEALLPHSWGQRQVVDCSHLVVLCARDGMNGSDIEKFLDASVATRGGSREDLGPYQQLMEGFISNMNEDQKNAWATNQVYIALGQLMATAAALEVDACPMEGINPQEYDKTLNVDGYKTVVACAMGYRDNADKYATQAKVRYTKDVLIEHK